MSGRLGVQWEWNLTMQLEDSRRTLMVDRKASPEDIRTAYFNLVRIWHPDRFTDPSLRRFAEEQLLRINEAHASLCRAVAALDDQQPPPPPAARKGPWPHRFSLRPLAVKIACGSGVAALCLTPLAAAAWWAQYWRAPLPPTASLNSPGILPNPQELMADWASDDPPSRPAAPVLPEQHRRPARRAQPAPVAAVPAPLQNGAELLAAAPALGQGELHVVNQTDFELMAGLIRGGGLVREIYIAPRHAASLAHIAEGVYRLRLEAGASLDTRSLRFRNPAPPADPLGPFEFATAGGNSRQYYEVIMRPNGVTPAPAAYVASASQAESMR